MAPVEKITDTIPRASVSQILETLRFIAGEGLSTFDRVRLFLLKRSKRMAPSTNWAMGTVARDVLIDLQRLKLVDVGVLPRTAQAVEKHSQAPCEPTPEGRELAEQLKSSPGIAFDKLMLLWLEHHPYFKMFIVRLHESPVFVPDITSIQQVGQDVLAEDKVGALADRVAESCVKRLAAVEYPPAKAKVFTDSITDRIVNLQRTLALTDLDTKRWIDTLQDRVVIPSFLEAESLPFDAVTFQHVLNAAKNFFAASWTTSHPDYALRVIFPTCEFQPGPQQTPTDVIHHGKSYVGERFAVALKDAYRRVAKTTGYVNAYSVRAIVCTELKIQPRVFAACLSDLLVAGPSSGVTIYTELPFDPPPQGEDYLEINRNRIGLIKLAFSQGE